MMNFPSLSPSSTPTISCTLPFSADAIDPTIIFFHAKA